MIKRLFLAVTLICLIFASFAAAQVPAASETDIYRPDKKEIADWMTQMSKLPVAQQNERTDAALQNISTSSGKTPRSDFQLCAAMAFLGNAKAQRCVGFAYEKGFGVVDDMLEAYVWLEIAHKGGDKESASEVSRVLLILNSAYPAPSEEELEAAVEEQERLIIEYRKEIEK